MGRSGGSIIATIITTHIARNAVAAPAQVCPGMRIHIIARVQPPGIAMPPAMARDHAIVPAAVATNTSATVPKNAPSPGGAPRSVGAAVVVAYPAGRVVRTLVPPLARPAA